MRFYRVSKKEARAGKMYRGRVVVNERWILNTFYRWYQFAMRAAGQEDLISTEACIAEFLLVHDGEEVCCRCRTAPPLANETECAPCRKAHNELSTAYMHGRRQQRIAAGVCARCGEGPLAPEKTKAGKQKIHCQKCLDWARATYRRAHPVSKRRRRAR